ncbi:uncharacterized protein I303_104219 [Kwoniella dejecticola CBS 10117]|uniref:Uncharacterized protein n=1 Tax=Kwoniella dejecticola CBS 10117 TaxID=1296121 RepID=A0A1A6A5Z1_9TREE|nr:uncharacterized protein I303_04805 [Kwoniella dejecticola CBS 10117]OBR85469.1 hypothetical protein I303_04805 [Kwoniella dejecticola CBS 10117]
MLHLYLAPFPVQLFAVLLLPMPITVRAANPQYEQGTITIPTSTVLSIGLGFLAFSMIILCILLGFRLNRIRKLSKRNNRTFREEYRDQGGFWGWLTSFGEVENNAFSQSFLIGGGGRTMHYEHNLRRWGLLHDPPGDGDDSVENKIRPLIWDLDWALPPAPAPASASTSSNEQIGKNQKDEGYAEIPKEAEQGEIQPISITPSRIPDQTDKFLPRPTLDLSVLIALPSEIPYNPINAEELPELIIGQAVLLPTIIPEQEDEKGVPGSSVGTKGTGMGTGTSKKVEIEHHEYAPRARAEWKRDDRMVWYIDGLH